MSKSASTKKRERTLFEWVILGVSLAAIIAIVAGLVIASLNYEPGPPDLSFDVARGDAPDRFTLTVRNDGGSTAEDLRVEVSRGPEKTEVEFRTVPKGDEEEATVEIGGTGTPKARVLSYREP
jgi:uncharacterized protein (TIGR02588 family)